jgi:uncharacterized protein YidB (DUF937 family)
MGLNSANAELARAVESLIQKHGGAQGLVRQFEKQGLGSVARSWVEKGDNHPISSDQLYRALGYDTLQQLGAQLGMTASEVAAKLSVILPQAVDKMTPKGSAQSGGRFPWTGKKKIL